MTWTLDWSVPDENAIHEKYKYLRNDAYDSWDILCGHNSPTQVQNVFPMLKMTLFDLVQEKARKLDE